MDQKKALRKQKKEMRRSDRLQNIKNIPREQYICRMKDDKNIVEFDRLRTWFYTDAGIVKAVDGVSFQIRAGETVGVVGESGCGKSVTGLSLMRLVQRPHGQITDGEIRFNLGDHALDLTKVPLSMMEKLRGDRISMIFQEPMTSLNPVFRIGVQIEEVLLLHTDMRDRKAIHAEVISLLNHVGIADGERISRMYPHELSGGMRQRIVIAMALACRPQLIIADEPTTALDVTIQAQILDMLRQMKVETNAGIMLITHNLGVVAEMADTVVVMYAGRIIETGTVDDIFYQPAHPYTKGLLKSKPIPGMQTERLYSIPGNVPNPLTLGDFCFFRDRCEHACDACSKQYPPEIALSPTHTVVCRLYEKNKRK